MAYIVKQKSKTGRTSIYLAESIRIKEKGVIQTRKYLGVLSLDGRELLHSSSGKITITNDIIDSLSKKGITYNSKQADTPGRKAKIDKKQSTNSRLSAKMLIHGNTFEHGRVDVLRSIAEYSGLLSCLRSAFNNDIADKIIALAMFQVCESSSMYLVSEWCSETNIKLELSSSSVSRITHDIGKNYLAVQNFFSGWIRINKAPTSLIHDTTSISSYAKDISEIEWGYNRDDDKLPQINIALVVDKITRIPIWYRILPGSIPDISSLKVTCEIINELGIKNFSFLLDRGFFSRANLTSMLKENIHFIIGVPSHHNQPSEAILNSYEALMEIDNVSIIDGHRIRYSPCQYRIEFDDGNWRDITCHIFLDVENRDATLKKLETGIAELTNRIRDIEFSTELGAKNWIKEASGPLLKYFFVMSTDNIFKIYLNKEIVKRDYQKCGVMMILSSIADTDYRQVLSEYRCRDIAEKVFDKMKNGIGFDRIRCSSNENMEGRLFVAFIATILRTIFENNMRKHELLKKYSVDEALAILKKIKSFTLPNGKIVKREIPAKCREILKACNCG